MFCSAQSQSVEQVEDDIVDQSMLACWASSGELKNRWISWDDRNALSGPLDRVSRDLSSLKNNLMSASSYWMVFSVSVQDTREKLECDLHEQSMMRNWSETLTPDTVRPSLLKISLSWALVNVFTNAITLWSSAICPEDVILEIVTETESSAGTGTGSSQDTDLTTVFLRRLRHEGIAHLECWRYLNEGFQVRLLYKVLSIAEGHWWDSKSAEDDDIIHLPQGNMNLVLFSQLCHRAPPLPPQFLVCDCTRKKSLQRYILHTL